jgi:hypothetical protein
MQAALSLALLLLSVTLGCRATDEQPDVSFERAFGGQVSSILEPKNLVARSPEQWRAAYRPTLLGAELEPRDFDWEKRMLIAVAIGSRPSGGYAVEIQRVQRKGSRWVVFAKETRPEPGSIQTAMITSPFDCIATPRFDGEVMFVVE